MDQIFTIRKEVPNIFEVQNLNIVPLVTGRLPVAQKDINGIRVTNITIKAYNVMYLVKTNE